MVKSRYLCSAPRPETWDERAEALLKSLGGSASKRESLLRETLDALKEMHADKQKTGPGRKSNAEHAIAFYEYVLETITESKEENNNNNDNTDNSTDDDGSSKPEEQASVEEKPKKRGRGRPPKKRPEVQKEASKEKEEEAADEKEPNKKGKAKEDDNTSAASVASMDTAEFISQHNDLCEVCNTGGELLMCSTCNLVFHLGCYRPKLERDPTDSWVCAYCIMSGVKRIKQNAKARKNAAIGVRLMARMRKQLARQKKKKALDASKDEDDDGDGDDDDNGDDQEEEGQKSESEAQDDAKPTATDDETPKKRPVGRPPKKRKSKDVEGDQKSEVEDDANATAHETPKKRLVGRPKKKRSKDGDNDNGDTEEDQTFKTVAQDDSPKKRPVGRPKKNKPKDDNHNDKDNESEMEEGADDRSPKKKPVGRPRKNKLKDDEDNAKTEEQEPQVKTENESKTASDESPKKRPVGRPRKHKPKPSTVGTEQAEESAEGEVDDSENQETTTMTEIGEGGGSNNDKEAADKGTSIEEEVNGESQSSESESRTASEEGDRTGESRKKKSLALHKISDALSESMKVNEDTEGDTDEATPGRRIRRNRKKATYYDPQNGPASQWQSDGANEWKYLTTHDGTSDDEVDDGSDDDDDQKSSNWDKESTDQQGIAVRKDSSDINPKRAAKKGEKGAEAWCKFCMDDKSIPVCCFCACRVCFGKHEQSKLLLCDNCDAEIHTFCLSPPLKSVPTKSWFCPSCKDAEKNGKVARSLNVATRGSKTSPKVGTRTSNRKSISPKDKQVPEEPPVSPPVKRGPGRPRKHPLPEPNQPPRKRGRPPKNKTPSPPAPQPPPPSSSPRKRGRPRKNPLPDEAPPSKKKALKSKSGSKRGPGRPPKSKNKSKSASPRKSSGLSASNQGGENNPSLDYTNGPPRAPSIKDDSSIASGSIKAQSVPPPSPTPPPPPPITVSRSGRAVKRTSFHDEIEEGEQHLRSSRYAERRFTDQSETAYADGSEIEHFHQGHMPEQHGFEHEHHHGVDPHFLANIPDVSDMAHLVPLDTSFIDHGANVMPLGISADPSNVLGEPFYQVPVPAPEPLAEPEPQPEEEKKPAAVNTMNIAPMVHVNINPDWHVPPPVESVAAYSSSSDGMHAPASAPAPQLPAGHVPPPVAAAPPAASPPAPPAVALPATTYSAASGNNLKPAPPTLASSPPLTSKGNASVGSTSVKQPRRKPGARECMQISRRFGVNVIPEKYMEILMDYCKRGKVEHLIRMRERLDEHSRFLESQLAGLESLVQERGELDVVVPAMPETEHDHAE